MKIVVFGAGRVGSAIARDLAAAGEFEVTVADISTDALKALAGVEGVTAVQADLGSLDMIQRLASVHDLVVGAVPGPMGFDTARAVINAGRNLVDISFFEEDPHPELDALARDRGVIAVYDAGIAPGFSNLALGEAERTFDSVERFECYVGGLPVQRHLPWEYRAVFSPIDVIAEYTRPARLVEHGETVTRTALTEVERLDFEGVGTLEAFNTDGLRSLLRCDVPFMKEKTMRYPGHAERMQALRDAGFFSEEEVQVGAVAIRPIDLTAALLFPAWQLRDEEEDITVMRIEIEGVREDRREIWRLDLLDHMDRDTGTTSMARTTGYTCTAMVRLLAAGLYDGVGFVAPEVVGRVEGCFDFIRERLAERKVVFTERWMT
jgi:lysine 6-dehydrogenase